MRRKLGRDLLGSLWALLTVVAIIAVGISSFVSLGSAQRILQASQAAYYRDYHFADFWIDVKKAPLTAVERIAVLPGIGLMETRVVFDVIIDLPDQIRPVTGRLISIPPRKLASSLNGICLLRGTGFSDDRAEEVIISDNFARAHGIRPGDSLRLILNRKLESFHVVGTAISPEYVYMVRGEGDFVPDPEHFGVLYIKDRYAREVLDFKDACNQITGRVVPGADVEALLARIERSLSPYGVLATTPRERQASHRFLSDEIRGLGVSAAVMPVIFLFVAALVLNILMTRLIQRQRTTIGTLKALGYSDHEILVHFLSMGVIVGAAGGVAGDALGVVMAAGLVEVYKEFFHFPLFVFQVYPNLLLIGLTVSLLFALAGTAKGVWSVLRLQPAEAMRARPPERGGAIVLERFSRLWRLLGFRTHIALRSVVRNRLRTLTGIISSALAVSIIFTSLVLYDSTFLLIDFQFERVAHSDVDVGMRDEQSRAALLESRSLPGVDYAEPLLALTCKLRNGPQMRRVTITALHSKHRLTTPVQDDLTPIEIPPSGLVLSKKLAEILDVSVGSSLELTPVRGRRDTVWVKVASIAESYIGLECYADLKYLSRIVGEAVAVNGVQLSVDPSSTDSLYRTIKTLPNAQGLSVRADTKASIEETLIETTVFSLGLLVLFAGVIAFGSMFNTALIEIVDRMREISTFRVLGYRPAQVAGIFLRESLVIFTLGVVAAIPLGLGMVYGIAYLYDTELFRMPVFIRPVTVVFSVLIASVFVIIVQCFVYRQIHKLDWLEGVNVRE
ncbi:MAG: ABC transporter permease [Planctomycetota bacterium]